MVKPMSTKPKNQKERKARVHVILKTLDEMYPNATCALVHRNPWELLVATILSAQCTDKRVNEVTPGLFGKYPTPADLDRKSTRLNSSHQIISYAVFCLKKKK